MALLSNEICASDAAARLWSGRAWVNGRVSISSDEMINPAPRRRIPQESNSEWRPSGAEGGKVGVELSELQSKYVTRRNRQLWHTAEMSFFYECTAIRDKMNRHIIKLSEFHAT